MKLRIRWSAPLTLGFVGGSLLVLGVSALLPGARAIFASPAGIDLANPLFFLQLFLHLLGHADLGHLAGNAMLLLLLGPLIEERQGTGWLACIAALTAVVTAFAALALGTRVQGLSGLVFACIGLASAAGARRGEIPLTMLLVLGLYLGRELPGLFRDDDISQLSHLAGGLVGGGVGLLLSMAGESEPSA